MQSRFYRQVMAMMAVVGLASTLALTAQAAEEGAAGDDPFVKVAMAKAKVEIVIRDGAVVFDGARSGWDAAWQGCDRAFTKTSGEYARARDAESRKPEGKNDFFITESGQRQTELNTAWTEFSQKDRPALQVKRGDAANQFQNTVNAFRQVASSEESWKNSKMDLDLLVQVYAALEKRLSETQAQGQETLDEVKKQGERWDREVETAVEYVTAAGHPPVAK